MKKNDFFLIGGVVLAALLILGLWTLFFHDTGDQVIVTVDSAEVARFPLSVEREYEILTENGGSNLLIIRDGKAFVTAANCRDHICVSKGGIDTEGDLIVCLPHKVVVSIESKR